MRVQFIIAIAMIALAGGCSHFKKNAGGTAQNDQNVITGGPVTGITIRDLPAPVRKVLRAAEPTAEVADIQQRTQDGKLVYRIVFSNPARNQTMYIAEDGTIMENMKN